MTAGSMIPTASATTSSVAAASVLAEHAPAAVDLLRQGLHQAMHCASSFVCGAVPFLSTAAWKRPERGKQKKRKGGQRQYYDEDEGPLWRDVIAELIPRLVVLGVTWYLTRGGGHMSQNFKLCDTKVTTRFSHVAGCEEAKAEIAEFVDILRQPQKYRDMGANLPRGALLCGPPGTGKTLLAKAVAGEAGVPFFSVSGSSFVQMYVGLGPQRVRELFQAARARAPCIIFIDEFESIGRARGEASPSGGSMEYHNTLNQLLVEMDGFDSSANVVVFAATNRAEDLDRAITRAGRLDRKIELDAPDIAARRELFRIYLNNNTIDGEVEYYAARLAELTPGMVGADISSICNEAAIGAVRRNLTKVDLACYREAIDRSIGGLAVSKVISKEEKRSIAFHEAGHAIAGLYLKYADPVVKITIIPRSGGTMGFTQHLPEETYLNTREQLLDRVCVLLSGRAAEQHIFGAFSSGASNDLEHATRIVYTMVKDLGMSDEIGQVAYGQMQMTRQSYSEATGALIDAEVRRILEEAYQRALALMERRSDELQQLALLLLEEETLNREDLEALLPDVRRRS